MYRLILVLGVECYAVLLAVLQYANGVRTDEAKYLLNIPYPHPPLARFILHTLDAWTYQEIFWRIVFASLLVQCVWFFMRLLKDRKLAVRLAVAFCWLFSSALLNQAGTIMMAVLTACQMMVFVYLWMRPERSRDAGYIGLFWLMSLFTAYQIVLIAPVVWSLLSHVSWKKRLAAFVLPLVVLACYTLTNPLVIASVLVHAGPDSALSIRVVEWVRIWLMSGSIIVSIAGLYGMVRLKQWPVLASFVLLAAYVFLSRADYYAVLFLPLSMAGCIALIRSNRFSAHLFAMGTLIVSTLLLLRTSPLHAPSPARRVMQDIAAAHLEGPVFMEGGFGHEWQYESRLPIFRYSADAIFTESSVVVCTAACPTIDTDSQWQRFASNTSVFLYRYHKNDTPSK